MKLTSQLVIYLWKKKLGKYLQFKQPNFCNNEIVLCTAII